MQERILLNLLSLSRYIEFVLQSPAYLPIYTHRELRKGIRRNFDNPPPRQPTERFLALLDFYIAVKYPVYLENYDRTLYFVVNVP